MHDDNDGGDKMAERKVIVYVTAYTLHDMHRNHCGEVMETEKSIAQRLARYKLIAVTGDLLCLRSAEYTFPKQILFI